MVRSPLLGMAPLPVSCFISVRKTLSHRVHFTLVSFSNAMQTNFCLIAQTNKVHIGALKVMGCMDDDPGHSCGLLLRLCTICSTFTHPTFGRHCESCTPFPYSSSAEPIRLSVQLCLSIAPSCLGGHTAWQRKLLVCPEAREISLQANTKHGRCLMSLADGSCPAAQRDSPCRAAVPPPSHQAGLSSPCESTASPKLCTHLTVSSFPSAGPSDPHAEATPQKPPDLRG